MAGSLILSGISHEVYATFQVDIRTPQAIRRRQLRWNFSKNGTVSSERTEELDANKCRTRTTREKSPCDDDAVVVQRNVAAVPDRPQCFELQWQRTAAVPDTPQSFELQWQRTAAACRSITHVRQVTVKSTPVLY